MIPAAWKGEILEVRIEEWNGNRENEFAAIAAEVLLPVVIGQDIVLSVPHQKTVAPVSDGNFHIFIWSAPEGQSFNQKPPEKMWGVQVDCRDEGYLSSGKGVGIVDPDTGWCVAELVDDNLYIHHDICHHGTDRELAIFRRLCEEVATELSATSEEKAERLRKIREAEMSRTREQWIKENLKRFEKTLKGTKESIGKSESLISEYQRKLVEEIRRLDGQRRKLEQLKKTQPEVEERYAREFEKLMQVPQITRVTIDSGKINVFTETLYVRTDDGKKYEMGRYRIEIYTDGGNGGVRFFNLDRQVDGYWSKCHHPHVDGSGKPCLGNIQESIPQLLGEYQYAVVALVCIRYLESVNTSDSAGAQIVNWPLVEEKNK